MLEVAMLQYLRWCRIIKEMPGLVASGTHCIFHALCWLAAGGHTVYVMRYADWLLPAASSWFILHSFTLLYFTLNFSPAARLPSITRPLSHTTSITAWIFPATVFAPAGNRWLIGMLTTCYHKAHDFSPHRVSQKAIIFLRRVPDRWRLMTP